MIPNTFPASLEVRAFLADRIYFVADYLGLTQEQVGFSRVPKSFAFSSLHEFELYCYVGPDGKAYCFYPLHHLSSLHIKGVAA